MRLPNHGRHQLNTTANFHSTLFAGTLDMQIEHHLFPSLSSEHQKMIKPLVQQTAREFGLAYNEYSSIGDAMLGHLVHMLNLSKDHSPAARGGTGEDAGTSDSELKGPEPVNIVGVIIESLGSKLGALVGYMCHGKQL